MLGHSKSIQLFWLSSISYCISLTFRNLSFLVHPTSSLPGDPTELHLHHPSSVPNRTITAAINFHDLQTIFLNLPNETDYYETIPNAMPSKLTVSTSDITVTVHLSTEKLWRFLLLVQRWAGPVSAAVYISSSEDIETFKEFAQENSHDLQYTTFHFMMEKAEMDYPHNILRNLALHTIESDYFVLLDVDNVTPPNCHNKLKGVIQGDDKLVQALQSKTLMVLAGFNTKDHVHSNDFWNASNDILPANKEGVLEHIKTKKLNALHAKLFAAGHGPTNYSRWYGEEPGSSFYPINYELKFEPYVLGHRRDVPDFWEAFRGFGFNKFTWYVEAHYRGFGFGVLREFFVVHLNHKLRPPRISEANFQAMGEFKRYLNLTYDAPDGELYYLKGNHVIPDEVKVEIGRVRPYNEA